MTKGFRCMSKGFVYHSGAPYNEEYPEGHEWHYSDHRNLRRDFKEAFEALAG